VGSEDLAWHPEVGGRVAWGGWRRRGEVVTVGRRGEGDEADRRAPYGSGLREKRRLCRSAQSQREYANAVWAEWAEGGFGGLLGVAGQRLWGWAGWAEI
jgi:hypothetical protein